MELHENEGGSEVEWFRDQVIEVVDAETTVAKLSSLIKGSPAEWVVLHTGPPNQARFYVLHWREAEALLEVLKAAGERGKVEGIYKRTLRNVLSLQHETASTPVAWPGGTVPPGKVRRVGRRGVAAGRVVLVDDEGQPALVGTIWGSKTRLHTKVALRGLLHTDFFDLGPIRDHRLDDDEVDPEPEKEAPNDDGESGGRGGRGRGGRGRGGSKGEEAWTAEQTEEEAPAGEAYAEEDWTAEQTEEAPANDRKSREEDTTNTPALISGSAPDQVGLKDCFEVRYRIEFVGANASPLEKRLATKIEPNRTIWVSLVTKGDALRLADGEEAMHDVLPPKGDRPTEGCFKVEARQEAKAELSLLFHQGASHLGTLAFDVRVANATSKPTRARTERGSIAAPRRKADAELLIWIIEKDVDNDNGRRYKHHFTGDRFGYFKNVSKSIQDSGSGHAAMRAEYLEKTYKRILKPPVRSRADLDNLQVKVRASGTSLCRRLLDPEVTRWLWEVRDRISAIRVHSYDPLIPWELVRLQHPDTKELDDRYLAEYGLTRWIPPLDQASPRLRLDRWRYLTATYPHGYATSVVGEIEYLTKDLPSREIQPEPIEPTLRGVLDVLENDRFDVLHLACHGLANIREVESARLLISDRKDESGKVQPVVVEASDVIPSIQFSSDPGPVVFLTACEGGQAAPSLTDWEGWPHAFLKGGASVFVGTSWSVRSKPAYEFSRAFYDALLDGKTLAMAATAGRQAAKKLGDASWLAYKVYGDPLARVCMD